MDFQIEAPDGRSWIPRFIVAIDQEKCIGCGRCYKVCGRGVLDLIGLDEDGNQVSIEDEDEYEKKVMTVIRQELCIGCEACARTCPKGCQTHMALSA